MFRKLDWDIAVIGDIQTPKKTIAGVRVCIPYDRKILDTVTVAHIKIKDNPVYPAGIYGHIPGYILHIAAMYYARGALGGFTGRALGDGEGNIICITRQASWEADVNIRSSTAGNRNTHGGTACISGYMGVAWNARRCKTPSFNDGGLTL